MTNFDKLKNILTIEELFRFISYTQLCHSVPPSFEACVLGTPTNKIRQMQNEEELEEEICHFCVRNWLESEEIE